MNSGHKNFSAGIGFDPHPPAREVGASSANQRFSDA